MPKLSKKDSTVLIVVLAVAVVIGVKYFADASRGQIEKGIKARAKGDPKAAIQIVEYIDFQCPACAQGAQYLKQCLRKFPDKFYLEMKYYPLGMHRHAFVAAQYAECSAQQNKFWPFHDLVVERQNQWRDLQSATDTFRQIAQEAELDLKRLDVCLQDERVYRVILEEKQKGTMLGVKSTPTYFINEKMVVGYRSLGTELGALFQLGDGRELVCAE